MGWRRISNFSTNSDLNGAVKLANNLKELIENNFDLK